MMRALPASTTINGLGGLAAGALVALLVGVPGTFVTRATMVAFAALSAMALADYLLSIRAWRRACPVLQRQLPAAFAIGVKRPVQVALEAQGTETWQCQVYDHADATLVTDGMPARITV